MSNEKKNIISRNNEPSSCNNLSSNQHTTTSTLTAYFTEVTKEQQQTTALPRIYGFISADLLTSRSDQLKWLHLCRKIIQMRPILQTIPCQFLSMIETNHEQVYHISQGIRSRNHKNSVNSENPAVGIASTALTVL